MQTSLMMPAVQPFLLALSLGALLTGSARADVIRLPSGEVLMNATILESTDTTIRFSHPLLGEVSVPREGVIIEPDPSAGEVPPVVLPPPVEPPPPPPHAAMPRDSSATARLRGFKARAMSRIDIRRLMAVICRAD